MQRVGWTMLLEDKIIANPRNPMQNFDRCSRYALDKNVHAFDAIWTYTP